MLIIIILSEVNVFTYNLFLTYSRSREQSQQQFYSEHYIWDQLYELYDELVDQIPELFWLLQFDNLENDLS